MLNSRHRQLSSNLNDQRRMRFSSYHDLSQLLKRKHPGHQNSMLTQKETQDNSTKSFMEENYIGSKMIVDSGHMRLAGNVNPQIFKRGEKQFYRSKPESRVNSAVQPLTRTSTKRPLSSYRNTSLKITDLSHTLDLLQHQLRTARCQMSLTLNDKTKLSQSLQCELSRVKDVQCKEISGLGKKFRIKREMDVKRKGDVWNDVNSLWYQSENLKESLFQIQQRVQKLQIQMGNHANL